MPLCGDLSSRVQPAPQAKQTGAEKACGEQYRARRLWDRGGGKVVGVRGKIGDLSIAETQRALTAHELIKVKVPTDDRAARVAMGDEIAERTGAAVVHRVGKVVILWRKREDL